MDFSIQVIDAFDGVTVVSWNSKNRELVRIVAIWVYFAVFSLGVWELESDFDGVADT